MFLGFLATGIIFIILGAIDIPYNLLLVISGTLFTIVGIVGIVISNIYKNKDVENK